MCFNNCIDHSTVGKILKLLQRNSEAYQMLPRGFNTYFPTKNFKRVVFKTLSKVSGRHII